MNRYFFILMTVVPLCSAQELSDPQFSFPDSTFRVGQIIYIGNELTKYYIIEQEMSLKPGALITHQDVQYDINRIYSLQLFTKVDIRVIPDTGDLATLSVQVAERWYFYPFPVLGIKDRDFSKYYFGLGLAHNNVAGNNVQLYGAFAIGYDPFVSINYINPQIDVQNRIFLSLRAYYTEQRNKSLVSLAGTPNFDEQRSGGEITVGKRFSLFTLITMKAEFLNLRVSDNRAGRTLSANGRDEFYSLHTSYSYDTRDLKEYARIGTLVSLGVSKFGLLEKDVDYQRYAFDLRRFVPTWNDVIVAGRVFGNFAYGGTVPNYGHTFFGYNERIRGHFKIVQEGEHIAGAMLETHIPIISPRYVHFDYIPFDQFKDMRYALNFALFADAGNTWHRTEPTALNRWYTGYGGGLHILLGYSAVGRIEFGIPYGKPFSKGEIILDLGAAL
ncbi:MAG: BamA/TamA family outer membrane protein [Bacteroidetes bacterium]|nr:BamA/TamA family outer membrane protein [Bacteroidota bacterium]